MATLDHVVWATDSVDALADRLRRDPGLAVLPGGSHPAWGTRNAIAPLGDAYIELVEVVDPEAPMVGFTARVAEVAAGGGGLALWCERVAAIEAEATARGYAVVPGVRWNDDGTVLSWRVAGIPQACAAPALPFLIQWDDPTAMPGGVVVAHPCGPIHDVRLSVGAQGPEGLHIATPAGSVALP